MLKMDYPPIDKLMIVAHPDDEILFGGSQLFEPGWKVVCVTNADNPVRCLEFNKIMRILNCDFEIWSYPDRFHTLFDEKISFDLQQTIIGRSYSKIVTHNFDGEYGHPHHIQLHRILAAMDLPLWVFDRGDPLPEPIWNRKLELLKHYVSQQDVCSKFLDRARHETIKRWVDIKLA